MTKPVEPFMSDDQETRFMGLLRDLLMVGQEAGIRPGSVVAILLREVGAVAWMTEPEPGKTNDDVLAYTLRMAEANIRQGYEDERAEYRERKGSKHV